VAAKPAIARMKEPTEDEVYTVVPLEDGRLVAVVIAKHLGLNRGAGELLWMSDSGKPIQSLATREGVAEAD
jgi:hypothetical protein